MIKNFYYFALSQNHELYLCKHAQQAIRPKFMHFQIVKSIRAKNVRKHILTFLSYNDEAYVQGLCFGKHANK